MVVYIFYPFAYQIGKVSNEIWANTQNFSLDYTVQLENPEKDFTVLNLADVHSESSLVIYLNSCLIIINMRIQTNEIL